MPPPIPRVLRATVERGDIVVIECPQKLSRREAAELHVTVQALWPKNRILILDDGKQLKIGVRPRRARGRS